MKTLINKMRHSTKAIFSVILAVAICISSLGVGNVITVQADDDAQVLKATGEIVVYDKDDSDITYTLTVSNVPTNTAISLDSPDITLTDSAGEGISISLSSALFYRASDGSETAVGSLALKGDESYNVVANDTNGNAYDMDDGILILNIAAVSESLLFEIWPIQTETLVTRDGSDYSYEVVGAIKTTENAQTLTVIGQVGETIDVASIAGQDNLYYGSIDSTPDLKAFTEAQIVETGGTERALEPLDSNGNPVSDVDMYVLSDEIYSFDVEINNIVNEHTEDNGDVYLWNGKTYYVDQYHQQGTSQNSYTRSQDTLADCGIWVQLDRIREETINSGTKSFANYNNTTYDEMIEEGVDINGYYPAQTSPSSIAATAPFGMAGPFTFENGESAVTTTTVRVTGHIGDEFTAKEALGSDTVYMVTDKSVQYHTDWINLGAHASDNGTRTWFYWINDYYQLNNYEDKVQYLKIEQDDNDNVVLKADELGESNFGEKSNIWDIDLFTKRDSAIKADMNANHSMYEAYSIGFAGTASELHHIQLRINTTIDTIIDGVPYHGKLEVLQDEDSDGNVNQNEGSKAPYIEYKILVTDDKGSKSTESGSQYLAMDNEQETKSLTFDGYILPEDAFDTDNVQIYVRVYFIGTLEGEDGSTITYTADNPYAYEATLTEEQLRDAYDTCPNQSGYDLIVSVSEALKVENEEAGQITIYKVWQDDSNYYGFRSDIDSVSVELERSKDEKEWEAVTAHDGSTAFTISGTANTDIWTKIITGDEIDITYETDDGTTAYYEFRIKEGSESISGLLSDAGYKSEYDGEILTNILETPTVSVTGNKVWQDTDGNMLTEELPDSVTVAVYQDGQFYDMKSVTGNDSWKFSFDGLPEYIAGTSAAKHSYSIGELDEIGLQAEGTISLDGHEYNISVTDNGDNDFTIRNIRDIQKPELTIEKTADGEIYYVNDTITYTIVVGQTNPEIDAENVVISDTIPDGLELSETPTVSVNNSERTTNVSTDGNSFTVTVDRMSSEDVVTITVKAKALQESANTTVKNTAIAEAENVDEPVEDDVDVKVIEPGLAISKDVDKTEYGVDDVVTYTIKVTATQQDVTDYNVVVRDTLPDELELMTVTAEDHDGAVKQDGNSFTVTYDQLDYNETATITVTAKALTDKENVVNTAYATADHCEEVNDDAVITIRRPALAIIKTADPTVYSEGETVTYSIDVSQIVGGLTAKNVVVSDTLPEELELISVTADEPEGSVSTDGNSFTVKYDELPYGQTNHIIVTAKALTEKESVINTAYADADLCEEVNDDAEITIRRPVIEIEKSVNQEVFYPGDTATYTIIVTNVKADPTAYNVVVTDTLPDGLTLIDVQADGDVEKDGNSFKVSCGDMAYGESKTIVVTATVDESAANSELHNIAYANADNADEVDDYADIRVIKPALSIEKVADREIYNTNDEVIYTISVQQTEEGLTAENLVITDTLPDEMELKDVVLSGIEGKVSIEGNSFTINAPALAYGETAVVTVTAIAKEEHSDVINTAYADADHCEEVSDDAIVNIVMPDLMITKEVDYHNHIVNDDVIYTIKVAETVEGATAYEVVISDTMPKGITLEDVSTLGKNGTVAIDGNSFTVSYDELSFTDEVEITVTAKAEEEAKGSVADNIAKVSASNVPEKQDDAEIELISPELSIEKTSDKETYEVGENVIFTITIHETVEDIYETNIVMTDGMPAGLTLTSARLDGVDGEVETDGNDITVTIPKLAYEDTAVVTVEATVGEELAGQSVTNTAYVHGDHTDEISDDATINVSKPDDVVDTPTGKNGGYTGTDGVNGKDVKSGSSNVQTGDNSVIYIMLALATVSLIGGAILVVRRRRDN